jgi:hypothetical protein
MRTKVIYCMIAALMLAPAVFAQAQAGSGDPHLAKAIELRAQAQASYGSGDYDAATSLARQAKAELALFAGTPAPVLPLPASYTVRLIPGNRDCLSKIAGYPFVYGDRSLWPKLYRTNKGTLKHPENADIILPGEILLIPSIDGEKREGAWKEGMRYPTIGKP